MTTATRPDVGVYDYYLLDTPIDVATAKFEQRHGCKPERVYQWVISHWPKEEPWGYVIAGPVSEKDGER